MNVLTVKCKKKKKHTIQSSIEFFFSIWVYFHENSQLTKQQEKRGAISLTSLCHFHHVTGNKTLAGQLLQTAHFCKQQAAGLEPGTIGSRAKVANR